MADLDEAVFAVGGVLNFTAVLMYENSHDCLRLNVKIANGGKLLPVVQSVAKAVPQSRYFDVRVSSVTDMPPSMAKRTIVDRRNHA
jgi:hypothetical protein